jgi:hypothetical protein
MPGAGEVGSGMNRVVDGGGNVAAEGASKARRVAPQAARCFQAGKDPIVSAFAKRNHCARTILMVIVKQA